MIKLFTSFILISTSAFTCEISTSSLIIKLARSLDESVIKTSNCSKEVKSKFINALSTIEGTVNQRSLRSILNENELTLTPQKVEVQSLLNFLYSSYDENNYKIKNLNSITSKSSFNVDDRSKLQINCSDCTDSGFKNFRLKYNEESLWLSAMFIKATEVIVLNKDFKNIGGSLSPNDISIKKVFTKNKQNLFFDHKNIAHYKINKFIPRGHVLKRYDLTATNLVKIGKTVDLLIKGENISIKAKATARQSGAFGKSIELINLKTKKKIFAEVTGLNEATIKL